MFMPVVTVPDQTSVSYRWGLASLSIAMLLSSLGTSVANVALPTVATAFNASFQAVQWIVLSYLLAITTLIVSVGKLGDIIGRRRLFLIGILVFALATAACGVAPALWMLIISRAVQGLGAAIMMALAMAFTGDAVPKERTGSAMGLLGTMSAIGTALGPTLGGVLIAGFGWRSIFLVNLPLSVLAFALAYRYLPADGWKQKTPSARFDTVGTVLLTLTLAAYALAMTVGHGNFGPVNLVLFITALCEAALFLRIEARVESPLLQLATFRDPVLSASLAMNVIVMTVMMATLVVGPFYLAGGLGLSAAHVGLALSAGPLVAALVGVPAGRLVDRFGTHRMSVTGLIAIATGSFLMATMPIALGVSGYIIRIAAITAGHALFQTANNTGVLTNVAADQRGVISGLLNLSRNLGLITGASVMGAVFAVASATITMSTARPENVATGMRAAFTVSTGLILIALGIAVGTRKLSRIGRLVSLLLLAVCVSPLIAQESPQETVISGQIKIRSEIDGREIINNQPTLMHLLRSRIRATGQPVAGLRVLAEIQDSRWWGQADPAQGRGTTDADADALDMHQAWAQIDSVLGLPVNVRLGRQEMTFANERFIGVANGSNTGRSFDAARATLLLEGFTADLFAARLVAQGQGASASQNLYGAWIAWKPSAAVSVDLFGLRDDDNTTIRRGEDTGRSLLERYTTGSYLRYHSDRVDAEFEGAIQTGRGAICDTMPRSSITAFMASATLGFTLMPKSGTRIHALVTVLSGDDTPNNGQMEDITTLFATNHRFYGYMDIVPEAFGAAAGLIDLSSGISSSPAQELRLQLAGHLLTPQHTIADAYGIEVDANAWWRINAAFELSGFFGVFLPGSSTQAQLSSHSDDLLFRGYISGQFDF